MSGVEDGVVLVVVGLLAGGSMRVLLSTVGSRGEVQPVVALAVRLREGGHEVRVCAPPDFRGWAESLGISYVPVGPELRGTAKVSRAVAVAPPTDEQRRQMIEGTVAAQFAAVGEAAEGCDVIVGGGALAIAAHSVSEKLGIRYVYASFAAITLPSAQHPPLVLARSGWQPKDPDADNLTLWAEDAEHWNRLWADPLNSQRALVGLPPLTDVRRHIFTDTPWLAADPTLGPWPTAAQGAATTGTAGAGEVVEVTQTGAWVLTDERPLSAELEAFLEAGEPPIYFGFGSMRASGDLGTTLVEAARALGRRAIVAQGWADLGLPDDGADIFSVGEVNQQELFKRVAVAVHHGGAGTTTAAGAAGTPQVIVPQMYDQFYWADRITQLGIGAIHAPEAPTTESLGNSLDAALRPEIAARARAVATSVQRDGAEVGARLLTA